MNTSKEYYKYQTHQIVKHQNFENQDIKILCTYEPGTFSSYPAIRRDTPKGRDCIREHYMIKEKYCIMTTINTYFVMTSFF